MLRKGLGYGAKRPTTCCKKALDMAQKGRGLGAGAEVLNAEAHELEETRRGMKWSGYGAAPRERGWSSVCPSRSCPAWSALNDA
jgi:hypothetical protein